MHRRAIKLWQNPNGLSCLFPSLGVAAIVCQRLGAGHMQPLAFPLDVQPRLVKVGYLGLPNPLLDLLFDLGQALGARLHCPVQRPRRHRAAEQVAQHFTGALIRQQLIVHQVDPKGLDLFPVLHWLADRFRKLPLGRLLATRTPLALSLVLNHLQLHRRKVKHLPPFRLAHLLALQRCPTILTLRRTVDDDPVRRLDHAQHAARMTRLLAGPMGIGVA